MGLDLLLARIDDDDDFRARWSYSAFNLFRTRLAKAVGIELDAMVGFGGARPWPKSDDPIFQLLDHSDCDGELGWEECQGLGDRLRELTANWDEDDPECDYHKRQAEKLARMCDEVAAGDADRVVFS